MAAAAVLVAVVAVLAVAVVAVLAVAAVIGRVHTCVGYVSTRMNSVYREPELAGALEKRANKGFKSRT